ncbi:MAG: type II toxin-antitoxin system PemK/MazF family toxin [Caulobacteraceae bacterium]
MRRGDIVTVSVRGDFGKPRPAVIIQTDHLDRTDSVLVCLLTTALRDAPLHRFGVAANDRTGPREASQVMVDKIMAVRRDRCGPPIGRLEAAALRALGPLLAFAVGAGE